MPVISFYLDNYDEQDLTWDNFFAIGHAYVFLGNGDYPEITTNVTPSGFYGFYQDGIRDDAPRLNTVLNSNSHNVLERHVTVTQAQYDAVVEYIAAQINTPDSYILGVQLDGSDNHTCVDFVDEVYRIINPDGDIGDVFTATDVAIFEDSGAATYVGNKYHGLEYHFRSAQDLLIEIGGFLGANSVEDVRNDILNAPIFNREYAESYTGEVYIPISTNPEDYDVLYIPTSEGRIGYNLVVGEDSGTVILDDKKHIILSNTNSLLSIDYSALDGDFINVDLGAGNTYLNLEEGQAPFGQPKDIFTNIEGVLGSQGDDIILGNFADNILEGSGGDDILDGGQGDDSYVFAGRGDGSDIIEDADGRGKIIIDDVEISGTTGQGIRITQLGAVVWRMPSDIGTITFTREIGSSDLTVDWRGNHSGDLITIKDFVNGDLGINLGPIAFSDTRRSRNNNDNDDNINDDDTTPTEILPAVNQGPITVSDSATTVTNSLVSINVLANDFDPDGTLDVGSLRIVSSPGAGSITSLSGGVITYRPGEGFVGKDAFLYEISDDDGASAFGRAFVEVTPLPEGDVDTDPNGDPVTDPNEDPVTNPEADPVTDPNGDPVTNPEADPVTDPNEDPETDPEADPIPPMNPPMPPNDPLGDPTYPKKITDLVERAETGELRTDPLVLDLDNNGLDLLDLDEQAIFFDIDNDGLAERTGWVAPGDGLLAVDKNGNGTIDNVTELFGSPTTHGFEELVQYDSNRDGVIDAKDESFSDLLVWQDINSNGLTDSEELTTLNALSISAIATGYKEISYAVGDNRVIAESHFLRDGVQQQISEVLFLQDSQNSIIASNGVYDSIESSAFVLPLSEGHGDLPHLQAALSVDSVLYAYVESLDALTADRIEQSSDIMIDLLYQWAGVSDIDPDSRFPASGSELAVFDARSLGFLEAFMGRPILQGANTNSFTGPVLQEAFDWAVAIYETRFLVQGVMSDLFPENIYNVESGEIFIGSDLNLIAQAANASEVTDSLYWVKWAQAIKLHGYTLNATSDEIDVFIASTFYSKTGLDISSIDNFYHLTSDANDRRTGDENDLIFAGDGDDFIVSRGGDDIIAGGKGNDVIQGAGIGPFTEHDNDIYLFNLGDGQDVIYDQHGTDDVIRFGENISLSDIRIEADGTDLVLYVQQNSVDTGDIIRVKGHFWIYDGAAINRLEFSDGTRFDLTQDLSFSFVGTAISERIEGGNESDVIVGLGGNDTLFGHGDNDTLRGGTGDDLLLGGNGADSYIFSYGDGIDTISDSSRDNIVQFSSGISADDIRITVNTISYWNDYTIHLQRHGVDTGDSIILQRQDVNNSLNSPTDNIAELHFDDGTIISLADNLSLTGDAGSGRFYGTNLNDLIDAGAGDDSIIGWAGDDTLLGGVGNDTLNGHNGSDLYIFGYGDGQDVIDDVSAGNVLQFGEAITLENLVVEVSGLHLVFRLMDDEGVLTGDKVTINFQLYFNPEIDEYRLDNGETFEVVTYKQGGNVLGTDGTDYLLGSVGQNTLTGGDGADILVGGGGTDIFVFDLGDSSHSASDVIRDFTKGVDQLDLRLLDLDSINELSHDFDGKYTVVDHVNSEFSLRLLGDITLSSEDVIGLS